MQLPPEVINSWIQPNSRILDLGCGDGALLEQLINEKKVSGYGLEIDPTQITQCIARGVNVIEQNLDKGLGNFSDNSFDTVVMTQTLQAVHYPDKVLDEMLRIGKECLVSFPNFGYWRTRLYLLTNGKMPVSNFMPYNWYDTPNIHFCTVNDFEALCQQKDIRILSRRVLNHNNETTTLGVNWPNLFGATAIYRISK
jgi:methionine biosynthesis protein MetW|tara:strand:+ start:8111 stop:8701 length:591 start_codon:yes stop_codon:yes gene_type:complete